MLLKKHLFPVILISLILVFVLSASATVLAVTACPEPIPFTQPDGTLILVYTYGDEFLAWSEDALGNLIIFDEDKEGYCFAVWTDDGAVSTGELIGLGLSAAMSRSGAPRHSIPKAVIEKAQSIREVETAAFTAQADLSALAGLPMGALPVYTPVELMTRKMLMIHVTWEDRSTIVDSRGEMMTKLTGKQIYDLNFGLRSDIARSVNGYFQELLMADEAVILPAQVNDPLDGYQGVIEVVLPGQHTNPYNNSTAEGTLMRNALIQACRDGQIELSQFDTDGNGNLATAELAIGFIVDGYESAIAGSSRGPSFWGVSMSSTPAASDTNGVKVASIFGQGAYHRNTGNIPSDMLITGIIAHEMGHSGYSFQDTYDYGTLTGSQTTCGQGYWSLQTQGSWARKTGESSGSTPGYQDAYNLVRSGFVMPGVAVNGEAGIMNNHLDIYIAQTPIITPTPAAPATHPYGTQYGGQYFLLQQRKFGDVDNYDQGAFGSISSSSNVGHGGMLIFHVDMAVNITRINDKPGHFRAGIEEAHGGTMNMQVRSGTTGVTRNNGDLNDLWGVSKFEFSAISDPKSGTYSYSDGRTFVNALTPLPDQDTPSGVAVTYIDWDNATLTTSFMMGYNALSPVIDVQPQGAQVIVGTPYELTVEAHSPDGGELSYQWFRDGLPIEGATEANFTAANETPGFFTYYVEVANTIFDNGDGARKRAVVISDTVTVEVLFTIAEVVGGNNQASLNFDIVSPNGKGYTVYLSETGAEGSFIPYSNVNYSSSGAHIRGLTNGQEYYAYIEYNDGNGYICRSMTVSVIPEK